MDTTDRAAKILAAVFAKVNMTKPHHFELVNSDGVVMHDYHTMNMYGIGVKWKIYTVKIRSRKLPLGVNPEKGISLSTCNVVDAKIVNHILNVEVFDSVWRNVLRNRRMATVSFCSELANHIVDDSLSNLEKAMKLRQRIASLSPQAQKEFYKLVAAKEREELYKPPVIIRPLWK